MIMPMDMEGLVDSLHKNGINLRYLGHIHGLLNNSQNHYFKRLIERTVLVRAFVKVLRKVSIEVNQETILALFVRLVNLFLGNKVVRDHLDGVQNSEEGRNNEGENGHSHKKTKKKKKNKKKKTKTDLQ